MSSPTPLFTRSLLAAALLGVYTQGFAADTADEQPDSTELQTVTVTGSINKLPGVPFRQAKSAVTVSAAALSEEGIEKADEVGRYQAGFTNQPYGSDTNTNWFRIRSAEASQSFDGAPAVSYGFFTPHTEPFGVETVEITKGADSLTYGAANAGGLVNYISKRPHPNQVGKGLIEAHIGNDNQRGIAADYTGALNADQSLRYRLVGSYRKADGQWNGTGNESYYFTPSLSWDIGERTNLSLLASVQKDVGTPSSNFVPQAGSLFAVNGQTIDPASNLGDPSVDNERNTQYSLGYEFSHDFGNGLSFASNYRYSHIDNQHTGVYVWPSLSDSTATRDVVINDGQATGHYADNRLTWQWKNQHIQNTLTAGIDYRKHHTEGVYQNMQWPGSIVSPNTVNVFAPTYGVRIDSSNVPRTDMNLRQTGFYLQDSIKLFNRIGITAGIRHDRARNDELRSGQSVKANHTSYSGSLMYYAPYGLNPYFAYSESFRLPTGLSGNQTLYDPNTTEQYEIGVKYLPAWLDGSLSLAAYKARDKGALVSGAGGVGSTVSGEVSKRKGIELQAQANLTDNISAQLAYTYQSRIDTEAGADYRNPLFAKHSASLRGSYRFDNGALNGLMLGAGIRYVGSSKIDGQWAAYRGLKVPSSTVFDLFARYTINDRWQAQLNVDNVGNRRYIAACDASYCYYGQGRSIVGKISYAF